MRGICDGRVVIITGAGRGIGRGHALEFARQGAKLVVNDLGVEVDATGGTSAVAETLAEEIRSLGGEAVANSDDVSDWDGAGRLVDQAVQTYGRVDVLVNNAGILRDRMLFNMSVDDWDAVMRVHLRGTFCPTRHVASLWRAAAKRGEAPDARIINTTSSSGTYGNPGQSNYGAAKAGIAAFTIIAARELERFGVTVNAVSPVARTRMTESLGIKPPVAEGEWDPIGADNIAPIVVWLASAEARSVTGRVFEIGAGRLGIAEGWRRGPAVEREGRFDPEEIGPIVEELLAGAAPLATVGRALK